MNTRLLQSTLVVLGIFFSLGTTAFASHLLGGNMTYTCLGNDQYEIKIVVYRDCNAIPFDNPLHLGIADAQSTTHLWTEQIALSASVEDTLSNLYPDSCLMPNLCISTTTYTKVVTLPFRATGYTLTYQRCCRGSDVINLIDPEHTGLTLIVDITETAQTNCNNSPTFNNSIPLQLGINTPFSIDMSATDVDGDSLVYKLYTPFSGATSLNPVATVSLLPLLPVSYIAPYSPSMPILGTINYDGNTGILSGTATALGIYALGLLVEEYNSNGDLLSTVYEDFRFHVGTEPCAPHSVTTNVHAVGTSQQISVYPNPTKSLLNIELEHSIETEGNLYTVTGQKVWSSTFVHYSRIKMGDLPKGIYMLHLRSGEQLLIKKIIKQ